MTAALYDEVVTVTPVPTLTVVRDTDTVAETFAPTIQTAPTKATPRADAAPFGLGGDPLVDGAARLLTIGMRHVYAALWRVGVLDVQA